MSSSAVWLYKSVVESSNGNEGSKLMSSPMHHEGSLESSLEKNYSDWLIPYPKDISQDLKSDLFAASVTSATKSLSSQIT